jgi:hypothetical protein
MRVLTLLLLMLITNSATAEVYKCQLTAKKIQYQSVPCSANSADKDIVKIEQLTPQQKLEAENRLKATEAERQALDKAAQDQQKAAAAKQEAEAARQQTTTIINPYPVYVPYPGYSNPGYGSGYNSGYNRRYTQNPIYNPGISPARSFSPNPAFSPNPNPNFSPTPFMPDSGYKR